MKEEALALIKDVADPARKLNLLREYLQSQALRSLHESEAFVNLSFVGGTALRFVFGLPRFSECLDFALDRKDGYKPEAWMKKLKTDLSLAGFDTAVSWNDRGIVHNVWIRIGEVLHAAGLATMRDQKLSIKLEIDTNPPAGARSERHLVTRHAVLAIQHYDLPSLMAGKIHALINRNYAKGRDWYDLLWYRGRNPPVEPNLVQLQNAFDQTQGEGSMDARAWKHHLLETIGGLDGSMLAADVRPFLEYPGEADLITPQNLRSVLG